MMQESAPTAKPSFMMMEESSGSSSPMPGMMSPSSGGQIPGMGWEEGGQGEAEFESRLAQIERKLEERRRARGGVQRR